ncbi:glycosyltransferase family 2 protein [Bacillus sp. 166amftsu]|uniref:glycosyltransferase family 2 protein n=1 Tax=Bacillus sp. 166amftsu TaxID=1761753 RepID=UPI0008977AA1|nr:glycosyltransferase family 2 protein [Bacillus sp. 166amftsu]SDZ44811.1 Glycosyl transferase family 2 [Bacillus sp. 166amftsu]
MRERPQIALSMVVKNEVDRYLKRALKNHLKFVDYVVIIDDASTDDTVTLCEDLLRDVPHTIVKNETSLFSNETHLRQKQWEETIRISPEWILNLDADEIFESRFQSQVKSIISSSDYDVVYFRLYDMWSETHYRDDQYWHAHHYYRPFLVRYQKAIKYTWNSSPLHCGRFPETILQLPYTCHLARVKHYGWVREEDRKRKYKRYKKLDPEGIYGWKEQYESILESFPNVIQWSESSH